MLFDARKVAKALKVNGGLLDLRATDGPSGHVDDRDRGRARRRGHRDRHDDPHAARAALDVVHRSAGSRSTRRRPAVYGALAQLTGIARDAGPVALEAQAGRRLVADGRRR